MREGFAVGDWIDRLAQALPALAEVQEPYLRDYRERHARMIVVNEGEPPPFPLDDLRMLYEEACFGRMRGAEVNYAPLRGVLDPVRHAFLAHPVVERVAVTGRVTGDNEFWMRILGSGARTSAGDLIAGLMARAAELPGDRFQTAARELNAFLSPAGNSEATGVLGNLDEGCDAMLFYGLTVTERMEVAEDMAVLPVSEVRRFLDREQVEALAPRAAGCHGWRSVGAVVRPFRWRPELRRRSSVNESVEPPPAFFPKAQAFLDLLAVSHATPVLALATLSNRIDRSAGRLLGRERQSLGFYQNWSAQGSSGFDECPVLSPAALAEAMEAFGNQENMCYARMAPVVGRLAEALRRDGQFAVGDGILDVAIALERMYVLDEGNIGRKLRNRAARFLESDPVSQERIKKTVKELYDTRSDIVHNRLHKVTPERIHRAFDTGFEIARRALFKLLCDGLPADWNAAADAGS